MRRPTQTYVRTVQTRLVTAADRSAANEHLHLAANDDGTFEVTDKKTGVTYHRVAAFEDVGDVGDEYNYCPPATDRPVTSADAHVTRICRAAGGVCAPASGSISSCRCRAAAAPDRRTRTAETVSVPASIEALSTPVHPASRSTSQSTIARAITGCASSFGGAPSVETARADTAFDVVTRPCAAARARIDQERAPVSSAPMISVVDAGDARTGATVIARG